MLLRILQPSNFLVVPDCYILRIWPDSFHQHFHRKGKVLLRWGLNIMAEKDCIWLWLLVLHLLDIYSNASDRCDMSRWSFHLPIMFYDLLVHLICIFRCYHLLLCEWLFHGPWLRRSTERAGAPLQWVTAPNSRGTKLYGTTDEHSTKDEETGIKLLH